MFSSVSKDALESFRCLVQDLQERVFNLKTLSGFEEINGHCDDLMSDICSTAQSAITHISKIRDNLLRLIEDYRTEMHAQLPPNPNPPTSSSSLFSFDASTVDHKTASLIKEASAFSQKWTELLDQSKSVLSAREIEKARNQADALKSKISDTRNRLRSDIFNDRYLRFLPNELFNESDEYLGKLELFDEMGLRIESAPKIKVQFMHTLTGHNDRIYQVLFLTENRLASCCSDGAIKIWNYQLGVLSYELNGHEGTCYSLAQLANDDLASGSETGLIHIWNLKERKLKQTLRGHTSWVISLAVLPNGNLVSCSFDHTIKVWNLSVNQGGESVVPTTIDGHTVSDWHIHLGVTSTGNLLSFSDKHDSFDEDTDSECEYNDNEEGIIRVWNSAEGKLIKSIPANLKDATSSLVLSNDNIVIAYLDGTVRLQSLTNDGISKTFVKRHERGIFSLAKLSNKYLVSGGYRRDNPAINIWNPANGKLVQSVSTGHKDGICSLSTSTDGFFMATGSDDRTIKIWAIAYN